MMDLSEAPASAIVLIVEDEPLLLMMAVDMVEDAGFRVVTAKSADEAVAVLLSRTDIRVVFTDIDMPGSMNGLKLAATVRDRWPPIEIIITSGFRQPSVSEMPLRASFFAKPYQPNQIVKTLHRLTV